MTFLDWLLDWRTLVALAVGDAALMAMFLLWDARHLASLTFTVLEQQRLSPEVPRQARPCASGGQLGCCQGDTASRKSSLNFS